MIMDASEMIMTFFNSQSTALWSKTWTPSSKGSYAGTCIFLIILTIVYRSLFAAKSVLEARWLDQARNRRYIVVADRQPLSERIQKDPDAKTAVLSANGVEENVRVLHQPAGGLVQPWRFSVDLPRSALVTVTTGIGYLLMLAVMTFNVGYFCSILAGTLIGELAMGRYIQLMDEHH